MIVKSQYAFIFLTMMLLHACSVKGPVHFYGGQPLAENETAQLTVPAPITVVKIDGRDVDIPSTEEGTYEIYLLPGEHTIQFKYALYWGDNVSGMLVTSEDVGVNSQFKAGEKYKIDYVAPKGQEEAYEMAQTFKAVLKDESTGNQVASVPLTELTLKSINTAEPVNVSRPETLTADSAVNEDPVKRLKFWWLLTNEEQRKEFKTWMKAAEKLQP